MSTKIHENSKNTTIHEKNESVFLDTLAQPGTNPKKSGKNTLKRRAVAKFITNEILYGLVDQDSTLNKTYWNSFHCSGTLLQDGKKITGKYCNNRWCIVCNRIRTAKMINGYMPTIKKEIINPFFVTLTVPNVGGEVLKVTVRKMLANFIRINHLFRYRRDFRIRGIRKIECTYNATENSFHPHFHLIIDGEQAAAELINAWLKAYPEAKRFAQDMRPADDGSMIELFKYTTKLTTKNDIHREGEQVEIKINPKALDVIFKALYKIRTFQPIGIKKVPVIEDIEELQAELFDDLKALTVDVWNYEQAVSDWVSADGECLTGCEAYKHYKILRL
jgi:hypothetical protein